MKLLTFLALSFPLFGMQSITKPDKLEYSCVLDTMSSVGLCSYRTLMTLTQPDLLALGRYLLKALAIHERVSKSDMVFLARCSEGSEEAVRLDPSTTLVRDLGVYLTAICGCDELAYRVYRTGRLEGGRSTFLKKLFLLGAVRQMPLLMERILKHVAHELKADTRVFFISVVPVFFYTEDRKLLEKMCDLLGIHYFPHADKCSLLYAFDNDKENIERCRDKDLLTAILTGYCLRPAQSIEAFTQVWGVFRLEHVGCRASICKFQQFLAKKAYEANNKDIAKRLGLIVDAHNN